ncbi:16S rRNA (cytosine(1402)-N(4))-methyltransferase RsmH [Candidatus Margulisiibacteriota bacterium]
MLDFGHNPVMLKEALEYLAPKKGGTYIDCTLGRGGHSEAIIIALGSAGKLFGFDQDPTAIQETQTRLKQYKNIKLIQDNFSNMDKYMKEKSIDGILFDLGVSSPQLDNATRGFSWVNDGPLDMRMDPSSELTAAKVVNSYIFDDLAHIFKDYGEERYAKRIASAIDMDRQKEPFKTTKQFSDFLFRVAQGSSEHKRATVMRIFQALRIEVNQELRSIEVGLEKALKLLKKDGRLVAISFHSLEDRIVKHFMQREAKACICPPNLPICNCKHSAELKILTKKPVTAAEEEVEHNPRSKSAKLRAALKI